MRLYKKILYIVWEFPQTVLAVIMIAFLKRKIVRHEKYRSADVIYARGFPGGISLGRYIILNERYQVRDSAKKHEFGHSIQSMYLGWLYLIAVGIPSLSRSLIWRLFKLNRRDYYRGYPENWANRLGSVEEPGNRC
jgi:hypothetical protein